MHEIARIGLAAKAVLDDKKSGFFAGLDGGKPKFIREVGR